MNTRKNFDISQFRYFAISGIILLAGCAGAPTATVRVDVPVFVPCIAAVPARPVFEFALLDPAASDGEKILALARDWPRGRKYEGELEAVVEGCR
jgi:hypothetical protein